MPRSLADGHEKIIILTEEPNDPEQPTLTELQAGIDAAPNILASDWSFSATDSETFSERAVAEESNANAYGVSNYQFGMTVFREFDETTGAADPTADTLFAAVKTKGTRIWVYSRKTGKKSTDALAATDEIRLGAEVLVDNPQEPSDAGGYIKARIPGQVQKAWPNTTVAAGA